MVMSAMIAFSPDPETRQKHVSDLGKSQDSTASEAGCQSWLQGDLPPPRPSSHPLHLHSPRGKCGKEGGLTSKGGHESKHGVCANGCGESQVS